MPQGRATRKLAELSAPLRPERSPYYVRLPLAPGLESSFPAPGWYWVPNGHHVAVYLAYSFAAAAVQLERLIDAELHQDAA
jgi:hypothetical protein